MSNRYTCRLTPGTRTYEVANPSGLTVCTGWTTREAAQERADCHTALAARRFTVDTLTAPQRAFYLAAKADGVVVSRTGHSLQVARRLAAKNLITLTETGPGSWRAAHQPDIAPFMPAPIEEPAPSQDAPADEPDPARSGADTVRTFMYWATQGVPASAGPNLTMEWRATLGFWTAEEQHGEILEKVAHADIRELLVTLVCDVLTFAAMDDPAPLLDITEAELATTVNLAPLLSDGEPADVLACTLAALYAYAESLGMSRHAIGNSAYRRWADAAADRRYHEFSKAHRAGA